MATFAKFLPQTTNSKAAGSRFYSAGRRKLGDLCQVPAANDELESGWKPLLLCRKTQVGRPLPSSCRKRRTRKRLEAASTLPEDAGLATFAKFLPQTTRSE
ncbi:MAG: hypothetical protein ACOX9E_15015, partial [Lentisphaeria bacterium]